MTRRCTCGMRRPAMLRVLVGGGLHTHAADETANSEVIQLRQHGQRPPWWPMVGSVKGTVALHLEGRGWAKSLPRGINVAVICPMVTLGSTKTVLRSSLMEMMLLSLWVGMPVIVFLYLPATPRWCAVREARRQKGQGRRIMQTNCGTGWPAHFPIRSDMASHPGRAVQSLVLRPALIQSRIGA